MFAGARFNLVRQCTTVCVPMEVVKTSTLPALIMEAKLSSSPNPAKAQKSYTPQVLNVDITPLVDRISQRKRSRPDVVQYFREVVMEEGKRKKRKKNFDLDNSNLDGPQFQGEPLFKSRMTSVLDRIEKYATGEASVEICDGDDSFIDDEEMPEKGEATTTKYGECFVFTEYVDEDIPLKCRRVEKFESSEEESSEEESDSGSGSSSSGEEDGSDENDSSAESESEGSGGSDGEQSSESSSRIGEKKSKKKKKQVGRPPGSSKSVSRSGNSEGAKSPGTPGQGGKKSRGKVAKEKLNLDPELEKALVKLKKTNTWILKVCVNSNRKEQG